MFDFLFPKEWSTLKKLIWLKAKALVNAVVKTITGNPIHILDALAKPVQALSVKLEPIQDLHGYDNPWPAGGGKNKWYFPAYSAEMYVSRSTEVQGSISVDVSAQTMTIGKAVGQGQSLVLVMRPFPAGQYSLSFNVSKYNKRCYVRCYDANDTLLTNEDVSVTGLIWNAYYQGFYGEQQTFTVPNEVDHFYIAVGVADDQYGDSVVISDVQLELGSTATAWTPYSNICPIYGHTDADVTRTGKNLFPYENIPSYTYAWYVGSKALADATQPVFVKGGKTYILSFTPVDANDVPICLIRAWHSDGTILANSKETLGAYNGTSSITYLFEWQGTPEYYIPPVQASEPWCVIQPTEDLWLDIRTQANKGVGSSPMLEISNSTPTDYQPYVGTTYPIPLGQTVYGGTLDVLTGVLTVDRAMVKLSDVPNWELSTLSSGIMRGSVYGAYAPDDNIATTAIMDRRKAKAWRPLGRQDIDSFAINTSHVVVIPMGHAVESIQEFLNEYGNAQLCYPLATPTTIQLTPTQVELLQGENNIWSDGTITMTYLADGNASDIEALNILLGGRYVNNHGEDEPTDREALDILLGGNTR